MYSFYEIRKIYSSCCNIYEVDKACDAFQAVIDDGDMSKEQETFTRRESIIRLRQIQAFKR